MKTPFTRRQFIKTSTLAAGAGLAANSSLLGVLAGEAPPLGDSSESPRHAQDVTLNLLDDKPLGLDTGVSFGVPWPKGAVGRGSAFNLSSQGKRLLVQSWPLAYW